MVTVIHLLFNVSYLLIYWFHTDFISFDGTNRICLYKEKIRIHVKRLKAIAAVNYFMCAVKFNLICDLQ